MGLDVPIVNAPMGGAAGGRLAGALSRAGGLGMVGMGSAGTAEQLSDELAALGTLGGPFGIGLVHWVAEARPDLLEQALAARPAVLSVSFGEDWSWVRRADEAGVVAATQVGTVAAALRAVDAGVDVLVAQGTEAGGHTGQRALLPLLSEVLTLTDRPVLAAGGIATGAAMAGMLVAGAAGVWIGTALLSCTEGLNAVSARQRVREASGDETVLTRAFDVAEGIAWPERWPGRALANDFSRRWHGREEELVADDAARQLVVEGRRSGDPVHAPLYAGEAVGLVTAERSATDVVRELTVDAEKALRDVPGLLGSP